MAKGYSLQALTVLDGGNQMGDGAQVNANDKSSNLLITGVSLVAQGVGAIGDTIVCFDYPAGSIPGAIIVQSDTVLTGATLNFGNSSNATKYGSLAAPAANTRYILDSVAVRVAGQLANRDQLIITIAGAALPSSFNLAIKMTFVVPAV